MKLTGVVMMTSDNRGGGFKNSKNLMVYFISVFQSLLSTKRSGGTSPVAPGKVLFKTT